MVGDKPCGNIGACPEEKALPEGDLACVPNNDLEAEDSNGVGDRLVKSDKGEVVIVGSDGNCSYIDIGKGDEKKKDSEANPFC